MAELGTRCTHRKGAGRKLSAYGCARRISTRRAGHGFTGGTRELGRAIGLLDEKPGVGDRVTKGPGVTGSFRLATSPTGTPRTREARKVSGNERQAKDPEKGRWQSSHR